MMCFPDNNDKGRTLLSHLVGSTSDSLLGRNSVSKESSTTSGLDNEAVREMSSPSASRPSQERRRDEEEAQTTGADFEIICRRCRRNGCFIEITAENKKKCKNWDCAHKETCDGYQKPTNSLPQAKDTKTTSAQPKAEATVAIDVICRKCRRIGCFEEITMENRKKCRKWECQLKESCDGYKKISSPLLTKKKKQDAYETIKTAKMAPPDGSEEFVDKMAPPDGSQTEQSEPQAAAKTSGEQAVPDDQEKTEIDRLWGFNTNCQELVNDMQFFFVPPIIDEKGRR